MRNKPEPESLRQSEAVYSNVLAAPATALEPCVSALSFPMDHSSGVESVVCYMGNSLPAILTYPGLALWRGHSSFAL